MPLHNCRGSPSTFPATGSTGTWRITVRPASSTPDQVTRQVPSSSQARSGSTPDGVSIHTGSDQGPAGRPAVTSSMLPQSLKLVVIIHSRPSWYRSVGAKMPPEGPARSRASCDGRSRT